MAQLLPGPLVGEIRGSVGGVTFSRNAAGAYVRLRTVPVNPNTDLQVDIRNVFGNLATFWGEVLTSVQREVWVQYGLNVTVKNKVGQDINLSGMSHYIRSNTSRLQAGFARIDDGPVIFDLGEKDADFAAAASVATQELSVIFKEDLDWVGEDGGLLFVYAGIPKSPNIEFFDGPWRLAGAIEGDLALPPSTPEVIAEPWVVALDQKQWVYGRIGRADGRLTERFRAELFVAA
jgi:hypothetical protein